MWVRGELSGKPHAWPLPLATAEGRGSPAAPWLRCMMGPLLPCACSSRGVADHCLLIPRPPLPGFKCRWPQDFDAYHTCSLLGALPLHGMLTRRLPGFVPEGELLFRVTVSAAPTGYGRSDLGPGPMGGTPRLFSPVLRQDGAGPTLQGSLAKGGSPERLLMLPLALHARCGLAPHTPLLSDRCRGLHTRE